MGYYSIYRIIKDVIKTIFGSKFFRFLLIFIIAFSIFFIMGEKGVFAFNVDNNGTTVNLPDFENLKSEYASKTGFENFATTIVYDEFNRYVLIFSKYQEEGRYTPSVYNYSSLSISCVQGTEYILTNNVWKKGNDYWDSDTAITLGIKNILYNETNIFKDFSSTIYKPAMSTVSSPAFYNKSNFVDFSSDSLVVYPNDFGISNTLYLHVLTVDSTVTDDNNTYYYYGQRIFALNSNSEYLGVIDGTQYYNIPRSIFALEANKKYIFFLSDNDKNINNSVGLYDYSDDFDGFVLEPTTNQISIGNTINDNQKITNDKLNNIDTFLTNDQVDDNTNNEIDNSLKFDNTTNTDNIVLGFFSRLSDMITEAFDYNVNDVEDIDIPVPNSDKNITLHSNYLNQYLPSPFKILVESFWFYLFGMYMFKFINRISIIVKNGDILTNIDSFEEVITNTML